MDIHPSTFVRHRNMASYFNTNPLQEGLFTICMGLAGFFLIPSTPRHSKFLTSEQKEYVSFHIL